MLQSLLVGFRFQVALPAKAQSGRKVEQVSRTTGRKEKAFMTGSCTAESRKK